jgi:hypothetical protein
MGMGWTALMVTESVGLGGGLDDLKVEVIGFSDHKVELRTAAGTQEAPHF